MFIKSLGSIRFLKESNSLFSKDSLNGSKVTIKTFIILQNLSRINAVLLDCIFIKTSWKHVLWFPQ